MSEYNADPLVSVQQALRSLNDSVDTVSKQIKKFEGLELQMERLNNSITQLNKDHDQTREGLKETKNEVDELSKANAQINTVKGLVHWGGLALIGGVISIALAINAKVNEVDKTTSTNTQTISMLQKNQDNLIRTQEEIRLRLYQSQNFNQQPRGTYESF